METGVCEKNNLPAEVPSVLLVYVCVYVCGGREGGGGGQRVLVPLNLREGKNFANIRTHISNARPPNHTAYAASSKPPPTPAPKYISRPSAAQQQTVVCIDHILVLTSVSAITVTVLSCTLLYRLKL